MTDPRIGALRRALEPLAAIADAYDAADRNIAQAYRDEVGTSDGAPPAHKGSHQVMISLSVCRAAREALKATEAD